MIVHTISHNMKMHTKVCSETDEKMQTIMYNMYTEMHSDILSNAVYIRDSDEFIKPDTVAP